jgi:hypothetical protein
MIYTLGRQRGNSTGTLCFFMKHFLIESKLKRIRKQLRLLLDDIVRYVNAVVEAWQAVKQKPIDDITDFDLE